MSGRHYTQGSATRPIPDPNRRMSNGTASIPLQAPLLQRGNSETMHPFRGPNPAVPSPTGPRHQPLCRVDELQVYEPAEYISQTIDHATPPFVSVTPSPAPERGESETQNPSYLSTSLRSDFDWQVPYSTSPTTSDAGMTNASTAPSTNMSRCNTNDTMYDSFKIFSIDSSPSVTSE